MGEWMKDNFPRGGAEKKNLFIFFLFFVTFSVSCKHFSFSVIIIDIS